jgi:oligogalacturonide lyase
MAASGRSVSRRSFIISGFAAASARGEGAKGGAFPSDATRYADPATELDVYRLTDPSYTSLMPAYYNRAIAKNSASLLFTCDRNGSPQVFRMDLKTAATRQLTDAKDIDPASVTLTPDNRSFCFFAGGSLQVVNLSSLRSREIYEVPEGWDRCAGMTVGPDGTHVTFAEKQGAGSRLRMVTLVQGASRTILEVPFEMSDPIPRPMRAQILYRQGEEALWLVNSDGRQNRQVKTAEGRVGPANWAPDGKTILYLNFPADTKQLNNIRESTPDTNADKIVAKTSQFGHFGFNHDTSVFAGASRSVGSPYLLLLLRVTQRERTLAEHKASKVDLVAPIFSPDSQRVYFQSDRHGKPAIYDMHVEKLVEKTETEG